MRRSLRAAPAERAERAVHAERRERGERTHAPPARRASLARSQSYERVQAPTTVTSEPARSPGAKEPYKTTDRRKSRTFSLERSEETTQPVKLPEFKGGGGGDAGPMATSSDSSESGGSLLCSLAPRWLAQGRTRRAARRRESAVPTRAPPPAPATTDTPAAPPHDAREAPGITDLFIRRVSVSNRARNEVVPVCRRWVVGDGGGLMSRSAACRCRDAPALPT